MEQLVKYYRNPDEPISLEDLKSFLWGASCLSAAIRIY